VAAVASEEAEVETAEVGEGSAAEAAIEEEEDEAGPAVGEMTTDEITVEMTAEDAIERTEEAEETGIAAATAGETDHPLSAGATTAKTATEAAVTEEVTDTSPAPAEMTGKTTGVVEMTGEEMTRAGIKTVGERCAPMIEEDEQMMMSSERGFTYKMNRASMKPTRQKYSPPHPNGLCCPHHWQRFNTFCHNDFAVVLQIIIYG